MARVISLRSNDVLKRNGAIIVTQDNIVVGAGYNGYPKGVDHRILPDTSLKDVEWLKSKHPYICHAEENAIYNANNKVDGCKIYCTHLPCNECAKAIIQNGIKEVIHIENDHPEKEKYIASVNLLQIAGIKLRQIAEVAELEYALV